MIFLIDQTDMARSTEQNAMRTLINTIEGGFLGCNDRRIVMQDSIVRVWDVRLYFDGLI